MKVLVCGSREWRDGSLVRKRLFEIAESSEVEPTLLHGDAQGADRIAAGFALGFGYLVRPFPANWKRYGKRAGFLRNVAMLEQKPDLVLAFQINNSRGTQHTIDEARKRGIPVEVHLEKQPPTDTKERHDQCDLPDDQPNPSSQDSRPAEKPDDALLRPDPAVEDGGGGSYPKPYRLPFLPR
jgi:hypothetical protein